LHLMSLNLRPRAEQSNIKAGGLRRSEKQTALFRAAEAGLAMSGGARPPTTGTQVQLLPAAENIGNQNEENPRT